MDDVTHQALIRYVRDLFAQEDDVLQSVVTAADEQGLPQIQIRPEEGQMLQFLLTAIDARRVIEIGTLAGYSAIWITRVLPPDGLLISVERDPDRAAVARDMLARAGLADCSEIWVGDARAVLADLADAGPFDAMFVDADKQHYPVYLAWALENVRPGGLIAAHNAFWRAAVIDPARQNEPAVQGIKTFNRQLADHPSLFGTIIPVGDGIAAAIRLPE